MLKERRNAIARLYDNKREDLNLALSSSDRLVHHHNGICDPKAVFPDDLTQEELLRLLHGQETDLTKLGMSYLGNIDSSMVGLDAGSGRGGSAILINKRFGCSIFGLNLSSYQVEFAFDLVKSMGLHGKVSFEVGDMCNTRFGNEFFHFIWACESTEHVDDLSNMFKEFCRITKQSGPLLIITWTKGEILSDEEVVKKVNNAYVTNIHFVSEYEEAALNNGWALENKIDLRPQTVAYWKLREKSTLQSGTESFMSKGFNSGALGYYLLKFTRSL